MFLTRANGVALTFVANRRW